LIPRSYCNTENGSVVLNSSKEGSKDHKIAHCNPIYEIAGSGKLDHRSLNNQGMGVWIMQGCSPEYLRTLLEPLLGYCLPTLELVPLPY